MYETFWARVAVGFSIGLLSSGHCLAVCGGLVAGHSLVRERTVALQAIPLRGQLTHAGGHVILVNLGRVLTYTGLATLSAGLGFVFMVPKVAEITRFASAVVMVLIGLQIGGWSRLAMGIERLARRVASRAHVAFRHWRSGRQLGSSFSTGMVWGAMPCGMVYSTLLWAVTGAGAVQAGAAMLAFGCGTLPAMVMTGLVARRLERFIRLARPMAGVALIVFGLLTLPPLQQMWLPHMSSHAYCDPADMGE